MSEAGQNQDSSRPVLKVVEPSADDLAVELECEPYSYIPEGEYVTHVVGHDLGRYRGEPRLFVHFEVCEGEHQGTRLFAAYSVDHTKKRPVARPCSKYARDWERAMGRPLQRKDRMNIRSLYYERLRVRVEVVTSDADGDPLIRPYSVVRKILRPQPLDIDAEDC